MGSRADPGNSVHPPVHKLCPGAVSSDRDVHPFVGSTPWRGGAITEEKINLVSCGSQINWVGEAVAVWSVSYSGVGGHVRDTEGASRRGTE